jgi:hypothetical protein
MENDTEFLLTLARYIVSINYDELTSVEKMIFKRFESKGFLKKNQYNEVALCEDDTK